MSFSLLKPAEFEGRSADLEALLSRVSEAARGRANSIVVTGPSGVGKTELLKQLFGRLFWTGQQAVPFFYAVNPALLSARAFSQDYLSCLLRHALAFQNKEQTLLSENGTSLSDLSEAIEIRRCFWAREIVDRFLRTHDDPIASLRAALGAPRLVSLALGMPVVVLIDEFHRLNGLHTHSPAEPGLVALFEEPLSFGKTPHLLAGNSAEILDMPAAGAIERYSLPPLDSESAASIAGSLLTGTEAVGTVPPADLLAHLGGNPLYISRVVRKVSAEKNPDADDYWKAYATEIMGGFLCARWTSILKRVFPDPGSRAMALHAAFRLIHAGEPLSPRHLAKAFSFGEDQAGTLLVGLYRAGFARGEFGIFRAADDRVVHDLVDYLYGREILGESDHELEKKLLQKAFERPRHRRFEMTLPMEKDAELVAAHCIEQIGRNVHMNPDAVGQMQIAVIEACINAVEHSGGTGRSIALSFDIEDDVMQVAVESAGREFVPDETGEAYENAVSKAGGRGWGIKLMKRYADDVRFERTRRGTKVVLIKKFARTGETEKERNRDRE